MNVRVAKKIIKIFNIRGPDVMFEVEYLWNGWVKKNGVNANPILFIVLTLDTVIVLPLVLVLARHMEFVR